jgi:Cu2+-exporting ATPase
MTSISLQPDLAADDAATVCAHCGLDVPPVLVDAAATLQFCCAGCRAVHDAISACGLDRYYAVREAAEAEGQPARVSPRRFDEFDDPVFRERYARRTSDGLATVQLAVEGVHCAACLWLIEKLPRLLPGVVEARLNLGRKVVRILWDDATVPLSRIARQLAAFGYVPHAVTAHAAEEIRRREDRRFLVRIAVAGALAGNVMLIAFALYGGALHGIEPALERLFRGTSLGLTLVALAWPGRVFFRGAWAALRAGTTNMDVPVAVGLAAGTLWSGVATLRGAGEVYFDSMTLLVLLLLVGRWIQTRQERRSADAVELLFSMTPRHARLVEDDGVRDVPIESLARGHVVEVRAGETVPADGDVIEGRSTVDVAWLTGEPRPAAAGPGDRVHAGSTNVTARLLVRVVVTGDATRAGRLMHLVEESAHRRAPVVRLADRIAAGFVPAVLLLAAATAVGWWWIDPGRGVENAIALLIITCPCALGLATPLAIVAAIGRAARRGIIIKGGEIVEAMTKGRGIVYLDKTGTITEGRVAVRAWHGPDALRTAVARLEAQCSHPVAAALVRAGGATGPEGVDVRDARAGTSGVTGVVDGRALVVGSRSWLAAHDVALPRWAEEREREITGDAGSPVFVAADGRVEAVAAVGDTVTAQAAPAVAALRRLGWRVGVLSGDHPEVARRVGVEIGVDADACRGGVTPEEKLRTVEAAARVEPVIMVGDGINDAAALAAATVGVAVHGGAEASLASADVYLGRDGLATLPDLITGASRTLRVIRRGLAISLAYNVVGIGLAAGGLITPLVAAVLMPLSSLTVITLAFRARSFGAASCR